MMRQLTGVLLALTATGGGSQPRLPQGSVAVSWAPESPIEGSIVVVRVVPTRPGDQVTAVTARLAGEPLHFAVTSAGEYAAVGGIPLGADTALELPVVVEWRSGARDRTVEVLPVARGAFAIERLRVAPRFVDRPDSATAARIARERARARAVSRRSHDTPRQWTEAFARPAEGRVTSEFGQGREYNGRIQSRHWGVDLDGLEGTPVVAANRGIAALVDDFYYAGKVVYLDHGAGLVTAYFHLSKHEVAQGDTVEPRAIIGRIGATGRVTGPHLHWSARYGSVTVSPLSLLPLDRLMQEAVAKGDGSELSGSERRPEPPGGPAARRP